MVLEFQELFMVVHVIMLITFIALAVRQLERIAGNLRVQVLYDDENDDGVAVWTFRDLIKAAEHEIVLHDDGNKLAGSIYDDPDLMEELRGRLRDGLQIRAHFNNTAKLAFNDLAEEFPGQVEIRYQDARTKGRDVHYKIADGGAMGYLSMHAHGKSKRRSKFIDCRKAPRRNREAVFRKHLLACEEVFSAAS